MTARGSHVGGGATTAPVLVVAVVAVAAAACGTSSPPAPTGESGAPAGATRPLAGMDAGALAAAAPLPADLNAFYAAGTPTFVVGTAGDDAADRAVRAQATFLRDLLFPTAVILTDVEVAALPPARWPARVVAYGGRHLNHLVAALSLPITVDAGTVRLGAVRHDGPDLAVAALIPATTAYPTFVLYAGTGQPGVDGINNGAVVGRGDAAITVADAFGPLRRGRWVEDDANPGATTAVLDQARPRPDWRRQPLTIGPVVVELALPPGAPDGDAAIVAAVRAGVAASAAAVGLGAGGTTPRPSLTVYVHADVASKRALTGDGGQGHAVAFAGVVHAVAGPGLTRLLAHEATHVLASQAWGVAGSALLGEGVAVWAAGGYAGQPLDRLRVQLLAAPPPPPLTELLGAGFRRLPEGHGYPLAGLLVERIVAELGRGGLAVLYTAAPSSWVDACLLSGTSPATVAAWVPGAAPAAPP